MRLCITLPIEPDLQTIYLQPRCCVVTEDGRLWCEDPQEPCSDCGAEWIATPFWTDFYSHGFQFGRRR